MEGIDSITPTRFNFKFVDLNWKETTQEINSKGI